MNLTDEKIIRNALLIANFQGFNTEDKSKYGNIVYSVDNERTVIDTAYHTSWNWLMPVIEKLNKIEDIYDRECFLLVRDELATGRIKETYLEVINCIEELSNENIRTT